MPGYKPAYNEKSYQQLEDKSGRTAQLLMLVHVSYKAENFVEYLTKLCTKKLLFSTPLASAQGYPKEAYTIKCVLSICLIKRNVS